MRARRRRRHAASLPGDGLRCAMDVTRHPRPAAARPAHLGHRPLQLPLRLLHAEGGLRPRLPLPRAARAADLRGDRARRARSSSRSASQKIRITGGEPLVRRDLERLIELLAALDVDLTLTTNGSLLPAKAQALADAGLAPDHRQPRLARRRDVPGAERRRLPGRAACSRASTPRRPPGCR